VKYVLSVLTLILFIPNTKAQWYDEEKDLKILSWNIHMLPSFIYYKTKKRKRAKQITEELNQSDFNILVFQEAFHKRVKKKMQKQLKEKYPFSYGPANKKFFSIWTNSGIWFVSDRPLIHLESIKYNECTGDGCFARKGAMMMEGEHLGNRFQVIGTHNNGGWINNSQFHQIRTELLDEYQKDGVPQIICGDYNTKTSSPHRQWDVMINLFDVDTTLIQTDERDEKDKISIPTNDIYSRFPDFIFVRRNNTPYLNITNLSLFSIGPAWTPQPKKIYMQSVGLSDHFPTRISLNWKE
jgi:endonuclease/exonuclease/phosphatase family metal-dependent hydrolase